jgi:hypothetical protein
MNPRLRKLSHEEGTVLLITIMVATLLGITVGSYLLMVSAQNRSVARSQSWNAALAVSEAGVEEALAQLNLGAMASKIDRTANGWGAPSGGIYGPRSSSLSSGSYSVVYTDDKYPVIYSTGYVAVPSIPITLSRVVRVDTTNVALFTFAMAAKNGIDLKGNGVGTDSFNSADPNFSQNGQYLASKASTNGTIASFMGAVNVGAADVHGDVLLGPAATDTISKSGTVTGSVVNDFNFSFEDVRLPTASWIYPSPNPQTIGAVNYQYVFTNNGDYQLSGLSGSVYVGTNANVRLYITGNASPAIIRVANSGTNSGNLALYMAGSSFTLSGSAMVDGGNAANLSYYGLPSNTTISFSGNASFIGTIYAPEADLKMGGGGSSVYDFVGACVVNTITMNGHFNFHYDENLAKSGPARGYVPRAWQEI